MTKQQAYAEPGLEKANPGDRFQFQRLGYFAVDPTVRLEKVVFNKTVGLRDTWSKKTLALFVWYLCLFSV